MTVRSRRVVACAAAAVLLAAGSAAIGQVTYQTPFTPGDPGSPAVPGSLIFSQYGELTADSPLFQRPGQSASELAPAPPTTLGTGLFRYHTMDFTVPDDGIYEIFSAQAFDGYLHLYQAPFDPTQPLQNVLAGDDDMTVLNGGVVVNRGGIPGTFDSGFRIALLSGPTYTLVTSTFSANVVPPNGNFYNEVRTPGTPAVPPGPPSPRFPIADGSGGNPGAPTIIELSLTDSGTISQFVSVGLFGFEHTWLGDLVVTLEHVESGTKVDLLDRVGRVANSGFGNSIDVRGNYLFTDDGPAISTGTLLTPGTYGIFPNDTPGGSSDGLTSLSAFNGLPIAGTWRLSIQDFAGGDTGFISAFSISLFLSTGPAYVLGDFNFDGFLDAGDIDVFTEALLESAPYAEFIANYGALFTTQYGGTLTPELVVAFGDFDNNSIFDADDIDPFIEAVLASSRPGASSIPEPATLGLLAPAALLLARRRQR
ncbi:MAG: hypothetical protein ACK4PI_08755 [Tepidisphaerales bacterium]